MMLHDILEGQPAILTTLNLRQQSTNKIAHVTTSLNTGFLTFF